MSGQTPTPDEWRAAMGYFPSGVTIVTTWEQDAPVGATVSSFCSVSLEPPLLLVCLDRANPARGPIERSEVFGVNILNEEHRISRCGSRKIPTRIASAETLGAREPAARRSWRPPRCSSIAWSSTRTSRAIT